MSSNDFSAKMRSTTETFVMAWDGEWTVDTALATRAPECKHTMLPSSLGVPTRSNDEWASYFVKVAPLMKDAKMTIHDYLDVPDERRSVCRSSLTATTPAGPFQNEYIWFLTFNETGDKIVDITEFYDSAAVKELRAKWDAAGLLSSHH